MVGHDSGRGIRSLSLSTLTSSRVRANYLVLDQLRAAWVWALTPACLHSWTAAGAMQTALLEQPEAHILLPQSANYVACWPDALLFPWALGAPVQTLAQLVEQGRSFGHSLLQRYEHLEHLAPALRATQRQVQQELWAAMLGLQ